MLEGNGGGMGVIKGSFQNILNGGLVKAMLFVGERGDLKVSPSLPPRKF